MITIDQLKEITKGYNVKNINLILKNLNECFEKYDINTIDDLKRLILIELKMYKVKKTYSDKIFPIVDSISFASMENFKFEKLYKDTIIVVSKILKNTSDEVENELINLM